MYGNSVLSIYRGHNEADAHNVLEGLGRIDRPDAIAVVAKALAQPSKEYEYCGLARVIFEQSVKNLKDRDLYLAALAPALKKCLADDYGKTFDGVKTLKILVAAFECLSEKDFMTEAIANPNKKIRRVSYGILWKSGRGVSTKKTVGYEDAVVLAAAACVKWQAEKMKLAGAHSK